MPRPSAAANPRHVASTTYTVNAGMISPSVTGSVRAMSENTGRLVNSEVPRSPCSRLCMYLPYCTQTGRSSPNCSRMWLTVWVVAFGPARYTAGSDGT